MRLALSLGLIGVLLGGGAQGAPMLRDAATVGPDDLPLIQIVSSNESGIRLQFDLQCLSVDLISFGTNQFQSIEIPGGGVLGEVGHPALPAFSRFLAIPDDAGVTMTASVEEEEELPGYDLAPMQPDEGSDFVYDETAYQVDAFDTGPLADIGSPAISRDLRVVRLTFHPVRYNPARRILKVVSRIRVDVRFEGQNLENVRRSERRSIPPSFDRLYQDLIVNYEGPPRGMSVQPGSYLVICPNDGSVVSRLQPLLDWRERQGYSVVLATTAQTGTSAQSIKNYIQAAYDSYDPPLEYVVLAGDATNPYSISTWYETLSGYNGEGDHPYTQLEGGDVLADIHIGRLSFESLAELETIVAKILGYEKTPYVQEPTWFTRACLVGDPYDSGYSTVIVQQWIKRRLRQIGYAEIDTIYSSPFVSQMRDALNRGDTIFSYRGYYGMSGWSNSNTYALTNGWKMPFVVTITCETGSFASGTARSEAFLRAGSATTPKAAIGAIGTATIGTHTRFNNCMHLGIFYGLIYAGQYNLGAALTRGKLELYLNYQAVDPNRVIIWSYWNNLMGDPAVSCWTGYPQSLTVTAPSSIPIGANAATVRVQEGANPCVNAQVCFLKDDETHAVGMTDSAGEIELPISAVTSGNMLLTVTKHDRHPHLATIPVTGELKYVAYLSSVVDDDTNGGSNGNGDGLVNPGETIEIRVQLKNFGIQTATDVHASLETDDPYATVLQDEQDYGDIPGNGTAWSAGNYSVQVDPAAPHSHVIRSSLDVMSGTDMWHSILDLPVVSADLTADGDYTLYNVGGNGRLDPGETGQLSISLTNNGGAVATTPVATLLSQSEFITVQDGNAVYTTIPVGGSAENASDTFTLTVAQECYEGYQAGLKVLLEFSGGARDTTLVTIPIGDRTSDDPTGPDAYGYYAFDNTDTSYPEAPTYAWIEIDPNYGGNGTVITLGDYGDYQDKSRTVDLPFEFTYYGQSYTKATVCSNGWLCMGTTWTAEYRNWTIPGAGGPEAMVAPFWDDLYQSGNANVYQYYDQANHRWIVEWSRLRSSYGGYTEVFEAILLDPVYHPTETGDGEIIFQYHTITNGDGADGYATVGIENQNQSVGLLYTFYNRYEPGAATLASGRAIRLIPTREVLWGQIYGFVRNEYAGGLPIGGATITVTENGHEYESGANGSYTAAELPGVYTLVASHVGFDADTVSGIALDGGGSVEINFDLRDNEAPSIDTTPVATTNDTIGPYTVFVTIQDPSPIAERAVYYRTNGGEFERLPLVNMGGGAYRADIPGQPWYTEVEYYVYARDVGDNEATDPADAPNELFVFYVAPTTHAFFDDMEGTGNWTVGSPQDNATGGIWVQVDPNGTYYGGGTVQPEDDHTVDPGTICWVTGNAPPGSNQSAADVDGGRTTLTSPRIFLTVEGMVILRYYRWYTNNTGTAPAEDYWIVQISDDDGATWVDLENTNLSDRSWRLKEFDLSEYISFTDQVRLRFIAEDALNPSVVEAAVDDVEILFTGIPLVGVDDLPGAGFGLSQNRPNPFNPRTTIHFSLEAEAPTRLDVYDVQGRVLRRLVDGRQPAGTYTIVWDGRDDAGHPVPSGIYLYRLESAGRVQTRKMMLLE